MSGRQQLPNDPSRREAAPKGVAVIVADKVGTRLSPEASPSWSSPQMPALDSSNTRPPHPHAIHGERPGRVQQLTMKTQPPTSSIRTKGVRATLAAISTKPPTTGHTSPPPPHHAPPAASTTEPPAVAPETHRPSKLLPQEMPHRDAMKPHRPSRAAHLRHLAVHATTPHRPASPPRHHPPDTATGSTG